MHVGPGKLLTMDCTLRLDSGEIVDSSEGGEPLIFQLGGGQIIPGLERKLTGPEQGDKKQVRVSPEEAYGARQSEAIHRIAPDRFPEDIMPAVGMRLTVRGLQGEEVPFSVVTVSDEEATRDFNHPLGGVQTVGSSRLILPGEA